jgi:hypothetical protein
MNVDLNISKEKSKFAYGYNSIKEFEHGKDEEPIKKQWSLKRLKLGPRGRRPSQHEHIPLLALKLNSNEDNGTSIRRVPSTKGGPKIKQPLGSVHATNVPPKAPHIREKEI